MALLAVHHRTGTVSLGNAVYSWGMLSAQQGGAPTFLQAPLDSADGVSRGPGACQSFVGGQQHQTCRFGQLDVEGIGQAEGVAARPRSSKQRRKTVSSHRHLSQLLQCRIDIGNGECAGALHAPQRRQHLCTKCAGACIAVRASRARTAEHRSLVRASRSTMALASTTTCSGGEVGDALTLRTHRERHRSHPARHHAERRCFWVPTPQATHRLRSSPTRH